MIGGPGTTCRKSDWYDMLHPLIAINSIRPMTGYAPRRAKWDQVFKATARLLSYPSHKLIIPSINNISALKNEEAKVLSHAEHLASKYHAANGGAMNVSDWFLYFSIDVMDELSFAKDLGMKADSKGTKPLQLLREGMHILGPVTPVPWLAQMVFTLPGAAAGWMSLIDWCKEIMGERLERNLQKLDVCVLISSFGE